MIAFLDTSVILRFVLDQRPQLSCWSDIEQAVGSELVEVECLRVLDRMRLQRMLDDEQLALQRAYAQNLVCEMRLMSLSARIIHRAKAPFPTTLGTLDALHLASALLFAEHETSDFVFATHDAQLANAARACGLEVADS